MDFFLQIHTENMIERIGIYNIYYFSPPIYTRHLRILPTKYNTFGLYDDPVVKFELLGCKFHPECKYCFIILVHNFSKSRSVRITGIWTFSAIVNAPLKTGLV